MLTNGRLSNPVILIPRQRSAARMRAAYMSLRMARSPKARGMTLVRRRSSPNSRSSRLVVRMDLGLYGCLHDLAADSR